MEDRIAAAIADAIKSLPGNSLGLSTLPCKGKGKQLSAHKIEVIKQALETTVRVEASVTQAKRWFEQGVSLFNGELANIADAKRQLQKVVADVTGQKAEEPTAPAPAPHLQPRPLPAPPLHLPSALPLSRPSHLRPHPMPPFHHHSLVVSPPFRPGRYSGG